jgi:phytoene dehydrogenase-like protein
MADVPYDPLEGLPQRAPNQYKPGTNQYAPYDSTGAPPQPTFTPRVTNRATNIPTTFVTKDSGERQSYDSGMVRDTQKDKERFDLLRPRDVPYSAQFLTRCAGLMARGAEKYGERNWEVANSFEEVERFEQSAERHLQQWLAGEVDEDHAAAVFFNLLAAETIKWKIDQADKM